MRLGRAEIYNGPNAKAGPATFKQSGDLIQLRGVLYPVRAHNELPSTTMDASRAFRQQWLALTSPDVDVVPLWFPDDRVDIWDAAGFYRVKSATCTVISSATEVQGVLEYDATLERVPDGYAAALVEQYLTGALRANEQGVTAASAAQQVSEPASTWSTLDGAEPVGTATGPIDRLVTANADAALLTDASFRCPPADFYNGAASVECRYSPSGAWFPVAGLQATAAATNASVRIGNGLVRATIVPDSGIDIQTWKPGADPADQSQGSWSAPVTVKSTLIPAGNPVRIVELSETAAAIEIYTGLSQFTLSVSRGDYFVHFTSSTADVAVIELLRNGVDSPGGVSGNGTIQTTHANGERWVLTAPDLGDNGGAPLWPTSTEVNGVSEFAVTVASTATYTERLTEYYGISVSDQSVVTT